MCFLIAGKGGTARAGGESRRKSVLHRGCKSRRRLDEGSPCAIEFEQGGGDEMMIVGLMQSTLNCEGEKAGSMQAVCKVCASRGDRASVCVDVNTQVRSFREVVVLWQASPLRLYVGI